MRILDICKLTKQFQKDVLGSFREYYPSDQSAIDAINQTTLNPQARIQSVATWIKLYGVHRIGGCTADNIARILIDFSDKNKKLVSPLTVVQINEEFVRLEAALRVGLHLNDRAIESLTSKTLWLRYPHDVPILDLNAERALRMLARIKAKPFPKEKNRYKQFVDVWSHFYSQIESVVNLDPLYPYKIRVFDRLLWWLGNGSFATADESLRDGIGVAP